MARNTGTDPKQPKKAPKKAPKSPEKTYTAAQFRAERRKATKARKDAKEASTALVKALGNIDRLVDTVSNLRDAIAKRAGDVPPTFGYFLFALPSIVADWTPTKANGNVAWFSNASFFLVAPEMALRAEAEALGASFRGEGGSLLRNGPGGIERIRAMFIAAGYATPEAVDDWMAANVRK